MPQVATVDNVNDIVDNALATTSRTLNTAILRSLNFYSPGELVFGRRMFMNVPLQADFMALQQNRQLLVDRNLEMANTRRIKHDYQLGQSV